MKNKFSKKDKLFLINSSMFTFLFFCFWFEWIALGNAPDVTLLKYVIIQCAFTFLSLIVYYLMIIAESLEKKNNAEGETVSSEKTNSNEKISLTARCIALGVMIFFIVLIVLLILYDNQIIFPPQYDYPVAVLGLMK